MVYGNTVAAAAVCDIDPCHRKWDEHLNKSAVELCVEISTRLWQIFSEALSLTSLCQHRIL